MKTNIIVNLQVEGLHRWKDAKKVLPAVGYLSDFHRHVFHICVVVGVAELDREIEFIDFKHRIEQYIKGRWEQKDGVVFFGDSSCEMIAVDLLEHFKASEVKVMEDGENGAEVKK